MLGTISMDVEWWKKVKAVSAIYFFQSITSLFLSKIDVIMYVQEISRSGKFREKAL